MKVLSRGYMERLYVLCLCEVVCDGVFEVFSVFSMPFKGSVTLQECCNHTFEAWLVRIFVCISFLATGDALRCVLVGL